MRINSLDEMTAFGVRIASYLRGGEVLELVGDVGAGKTTFTKGLARGMGIKDAVQSPTFTISREYDTATELRLVHYDFYRLNEAGIMAEELADSLANPHNITVVEWAETVMSVLPEDRLTVTINLVADDENAREVFLTAGGVLSQKLLVGVGA